MVLPVGVFTILPTGFFGRIAFCTKSRWDISTFLVIADTFFDRYKEKGARNGEFGQKWKMCS